MATLTRIYQGRITRIERSGGARLDAAVLWQHHGLFQDGVNYYFLALAAMAPGDGSPPARWAQRVRECWHGLDSLPQFSADFDQAAELVLAPSRASAAQRAAALAK